MGQRSTGDGKWRTKNIVEDRIEGKGDTELGDKQKIRRGNRGCVESAWVGKNQEEGSGEVRERGE